MADKKWTNVEKLEHIGLLGDIRLRLEAESEDDTSKDNKINNLSVWQLTREYCAWELGEESLADDILNFYKRMNEDE